MNIYLSAHFFCVLFCKSLWEPHENQSFIDIFSHKFGKRVITQRVIIIPHENDVQKLGGTSIKRVEVFSKREKRIVDTLKEAITSTGIFLWLPSTLAQRIRGKIGSIQGASTVRTPEKNAIKIRLMEKIYKIIYPKRFHKKQLTIFLVSYYTKKT